MKVIRYLAVWISLAIVQQANGQQNGLKKLIPREFIGQYAGSIGFISLGANYSLAKKHIDVGLLYGYVPKSLGGRLDVLSLKFKYNPLELKLGDQHKLYPFNPTVFVSGTLNKHFYYKWPTNQYPKDYYWWNSALRIHLGFDVEYEYMLKGNQFVKFISLYTELNTNDLYLNSYFMNRKFLTLGSILKLGFGVKVGI